MSSNFPENQFAKARKRALGLLGKRARSKHELSRYLKKSGFSEDLVNNIIAEFERNGLVDDLGFCVDWIRWRMEKRPRGTDFLRWELARKGIARPVIEEALRRCEEITNEAETLDKVLASELKGRVASEKDKLRFARRFIAHGFKPEIVREIVSGIASSDGDECF